MRKYIPNGYTHGETLVVNDLLLPKQGLLRSDETVDSFLLTNRSWRRINYALSGLPGRAIDYFLQSASDQEPVRVLDIGAGINRRAANGITRAYKNQKGLLHVIGVDLTASDKKVKSSTIMGDAWSLPLQDKSVDVAYSYMGVSMTRPTPERLRTVLDEVIRVLKPGGIFFVNASTYASAPEAESQFDRITPEDANLYSARLGTYALGSLSIFVPSLARKIATTTNREQSIRLLAVTNGPAGPLLDNIATDLEDVRPLIIRTSAEAPR